MMMQRFIQTYKVSKYIESSMTNMRLCLKPDVERLDDELSDEALDRDIERCACQHQVCNTSQYHDDIQGIDQICSKRSFERRS